MADGTLIFDTKLDTKGLQTGLKGVDDKLKGIQKSATISLGAITTGLVGAGTAGIKFNAQIEQYTATFETFTGSVDEANKTIERLKTLGAETPFEFTDLAETTQLLMAYGFSADEAVNSLTMLGDAAQGDVEKLNSIATGFARMKSSGKVTLEYLNLMIENGFNPLNQVAEDTGMTMAEVYDAISNGEITFEQIQSAMEKMTGEGGQYFGLMEKQSKTLNGMLSTLSDTVQMKLGEAFQFANDAIVALLPSLISFIENLDIQEVAKYVSIITGSLAGLIGMLGTLRGAIKLFDIVTTVKSLGGLSAVVSTFTSSIGLMLTTIAPVVATFLAIIAVVTAFGLAITQLWNTSEEFRTAVTDMIANFSSIFTTLYANVLKPIFDNVIRAMDNVWTNGIQPLWNQFVNFIGAITVKLSELLNSVMPVVNYFIDTFGPIIVEVVNTVVTAFSNAVNYILTYFGNLFNSLAQIVAGIIDIFSGIIDFIVGIFTGDWSKAWDGVKKIFIGIWETLSGVVSGVWNNILNLFTNGGKIFSGVVNGIANVFKNIVNSLIQGINSVIAVPFNTINGILNWIKKISILGFQPFNGLWDYNPLPVPQIPMLEKGGVLKKGQVGLLEGNGAEAVVPLERNKYWVQAVAKEFARIMPEIKGGTTQNINFYQKVSTPDEVSRKLRIDARLGLIG